MYVLMGQSGMVLLALYVDDLLVAANNKALLEEVKQMLISQFKMKQLGELTYCLGVQVLRNRSLGTISVYQTKYIIDILSRFNLGEAKPVPTPIAVGEKLSMEDQPLTEDENQK